MMAGGGMDRLMQNPSVRRMAEQYQSGGGMPDMSQLANDPDMKDL
jgi:small glutamine-rich tetratricopeptide repeat-containing protein alpha